MSTLNSAFPDNDFSSLRPDHFMRERTVAEALAEINRSLQNVTGSSGKHL